MLFIHPMWDNESQRIGKQKCTPTGYALHLIGELIGFVGLLLLLAVLGVFVGRWIAGTFHASLWWWLLLPFGIGIVSELVFQFSWWLAIRRGFRYDYEHREASWLEAGNRRTYRVYGGTSRSI